MKKCIFSILAGCLFFAGSLQAQSSGKFNISAGIGLAPTFIADGANVNTPPVSLNIGYRIAKNFNLSAFAGYSSYDAASPYLISDGKIATMSNKQLLTALRGEVRKDFSEKFDLYGGGMFGYNFTTTREFDPGSGETVVRPKGTPSPYDPDAPGGSFLYSGFVGATYYLQHGLGIFVEAGYGVSLFSTGLTVRL